MRSWSAVAPALTQDRHIPCISCEQVIEIKPVAMSNLEIVFLIIGLIVFGVIDLYLKARR
jgi:hypothetical protein